MTRQRRMTQDGWLLAPFYLIINLSAPSWIEGPGRIKMNGNRIRSKGNVAFGYTQRETFQLV
jgi:hypothetical protein